ncbi:MAG: hypothetical protein L6Q54_02040 [Leptospiraceae bacterium]|nr:hypothetical protein [Leptospiraceae bacterium]MCK6380020.1 hypothetical protein [Leptospiraceae bacterium]NUM40323.1 hypothetical protein [Leptospiraceae bacterium]
MPFSISGNLNLIEDSSLRKFAKNFGIILSDKQFEKQQHQIIKTALKNNKSLSQILLSLTKSELISLVYILTQFGDVTLEETPEEYSNMEKIPFVIEWQKSKFMLPYEIIDYLSSEKIFKNQNYLFSLLPQLSLKEKKSWIRWIGVDFEKEFENDINHEILYHCRLLQKPFKGKSIILENEFFLTQVWSVGSNEIVDWFYKKLTPFYYSMHELSKNEQSPFIIHLLETIKAGKYILKEVEGKFKLVATIEGTTPQLRDTIFQYEIERNTLKHSLFSQKNPSEEIFSDKNTLLL